MVVSNSLHAEGGMRMQGPKQDCLYPSGRTSPIDFNNMAFGHEVLQLLDVSLDLVRHHLANCNATKGQALLLKSPCRGALQCGEGGRPGDSGNSVWEYGHVGDPRSE